MIDLDTARQAPRTVQEARERFVFWQTKEHYARADVKAARDRWPWPTIPTPWPTPFLFSETDKERAARQAKDAAWLDEQMKEYKQHCDEVKENRAKAMPPVQWLQAEAEYHRIWFTGWVTAFELGDKAVAIERIRAGVGEVMKGT